MKTVRFFAWLVPILGALSSLPVQAQAEPSLPEGAERAVAPRFDETRNFAGNRFYERRFKWGYVDEKGEEVIPLRFDEASNFTANGLAAVAVEKPEDRKRRGNQRPADSR
jgi:hypothetical protein